MKLTLRGQFFYLVIISWNKTVWSLLEPIKKRTVEILTVRSARLLDNATGRFYVVQMKKCSAFCDGALLYI